MKLFAAVVACLVLLGTVSVEARGKDPKDCEGAEIDASWRRVVECVAVCNRAIWMALLFVRQSSISFVHMLIMKLAAWSAQVVLRTTAFVVV